MGPRGIAVLLAVLACAGTASAQTEGFVLTPGIETPRGELVAGITFSDFIDVNSQPSCEELKLPCLSPRTSPDFGWTLSGARSISDWLALTGEIAAVRNEWYAAPRAIGPSVNHVYAFMMGPRIGTPFVHASYGQPLDYRIYGQVLVGAVVSEAAEGGNAVRPGVGIDVHTRSGAIVRAQFDYCFVQDDTQRRHLSGSRVMIGLVVGIE